MIEILKSLITKKSITPADDGALDYVANFLKDLGFYVEIKTFQSSGSYPVRNLYARIGNRGSNFCFAGHTDVVPVNNPDEWIVSPFSGEVLNGNIYGRGVVDMKGAIAAMLSATRRYLSTNKLNGSISFLITGDEEAKALDGTSRMLEYLHTIGEKIDYCLVGEPTNPDVFGEMIKIGRRGSINFKIQIKGKQGHVAYPENAKNPIYEMLNFLSSLKSTPLDSGNSNFPPSNLEITTIDVGNNTTNIIPEEISAAFNVRYNTQHSEKTLIELIQSKAKHSIHLEYHLECINSASPFLTENQTLVEVLSQIIKEVTRSTPILSTTGGTSDARFIKSYAPVIEFGLVNKTAHQENECCKIEDIEKLEEIYYRLIDKILSI